MFHSNSSITRRPASLHQVPAGSGSPASAVLSGRYDSPWPVPPRFVAFAWRYHPCTPDSLPSVWRAAPTGRGVSQSAPVAPAALMGGDHGASHVPAEPQLHLCPALRPRRDRGPQAHTMPRHGPRSKHDGGSHEYHFRGSITRLQCSLSTLRSAGCPDTTQDSLPAAGQLYRADATARRVPTEGFRSVLRYISSSFHRLRGASFVWPLNFLRGPWFVIRCPFRNSPALPFRSPLNTLLTTED